MIQLKIWLNFQRKTGAHIIVDYFTAKPFLEHYNDDKAKIITSIAIFYDLEDPNQFVSNIAKILDENGIWVIELKYLPTMILKNAFDEIVHEHLEYYHFSVIECMLKKYGLKVIDASLNDI